MEVGDWLRGLGLERYAEAFRENDVDAAVLPELTAEDLIALGVSSVGHRRRLLAALAALRQGGPPAGATSAAADAGPSTTVPSSPAATPRPPKAERRQLTVMFVDLVGSTALAARLDPEEMGEVLRAYHGAAAGEIVRFEGHVAKYLGDGVLAYFGWPRAHEDDAERAVRAGLALVGAVGRLAPRPGVQLQVRAGIATGLVVVGDLLGEGAAREEAVVGETPNLAARLQALAAPDSVIIGPSTRRLVGGLFELEDLGAYDLKGFGAPVQAWRVLAPRAAESRFEAHRAADLTPLVGREEELALLLRRFEQAREGEGRVVLLAGEPGIGKSRLALALRERLREEPRTRLRYQASPYHASSPLHPVIEQLVRAAGLAAGDNADAKLANVEALLRQALADPGEALPPIAMLLGIPTSGRYALPEMTPPERKARIFRALLAQLEGLAARQPVLMTLEDAHWLDPSTRELFELAVDRIRDLPVLLVVTARPEFVPPWAGRPHVTVLTVNRLGGREAAAIAGQAAGGKPLPAEVLDRIVAQTDGVPLFVEELTKAVLEAGLLEDAGDRYVLKGPLATLAVPDTLHASLLARLDRLAPVREVAQVAACIGREFDHELLAAVAPVPEERIVAALDALVASELVLRRGIAPAATYAFKHALVRDAAYGSLLKSRLQQLHARIADALERRFATTRAEIPPELVAWHHAAADNVDAAIALWRQAAHRALARSANSEAATHLRSALDLLARRPGGREEVETEIQLWLELGAALIPMRGQASEEVRRAYARAEELCRAGEAAPGQLFAALRGQWNCHLLRSELRQASVLVPEIAALAERSGDPDMVLAACRASGTSRFQGGEMAVARAELERGVALWRLERHSDYVAAYGEDPGLYCAVYRAWAEDMLGRRDRALDGMRRVQARARDFPDRFSQAVALVYASTLRQFRREPEAAPGGRGAYDRAVRGLRPPAVAGLGRGGAGLGAGAPGRCGGRGRGGPARHRGMASHTRAARPAALPHAARGSAGRGRATARRARGVGTGVYGDGADRAPRVRG